jgi:hypothetical protein
VADALVLMSDGLMSAVVNRAALPRLYDCSLSFTRRWFLPRADSIELLVGRRVSVTGALTKRAGHGGGKSFRGRERLFGASGGAAALSTPGGKMGQLSAWWGLW